MEAKTLIGTRTSQWRPLVILLLLIARLVWQTGFTADHQVSTEGYVELVLTASVLVIACANLIKPPRLILDEHGFTWRSWRSSGTYPWASIDSFFIGPAILGWKPKIAFNFLPDRIPSQVGATELNRSMNGFDRSMNNVWNISTDDLVNLLNQHVSRAKSAAT